MSMPSIHLDCAECDFHGCTSVTWGLYSYLVNNEEIPVNRVLGWCSDCDSFQPIECFDPEESFQEIVKSRDQLKRFQSSLIMQILNRTRRNQIQYYQDEINRHALNLYMISKRKGTEKCLTCGSSDTIKFDGDYSLEYESGLYQGVKRTGFIHPKCGGEFIATPNPMRYHMRFTPKYYDINGLLIPDNSS